MTREPAASPGAILDNISSSTLLYYFRQEGPGSTCFTVHAPVGHAGGDHWILINWARDAVSFDVAARGDFDEQTYSVSLPEEGYTMSVSLMKYKYWITFEQHKEGHKSVVSLSSQAR